MFRSTWTIRLAAALGAFFLRLLMRTVRCHIQVNGQRVHPNDPGVKGRFIYAIWHEGQLFLGGGQSKRKFCLLVSQSRDGELVADIVRRLGHRVARGSSTRGGAQGLWEMVAAAETCHLAVTVDGPRGPRRRVKQGVIYLASRTGLPIVPAGIAFRRAWRAKSWDRFCVPCPGTDAYAYVGPLLHVPPEISRKEMEHYRKTLEERIHAATQAAEDWAAGRIRMKAEDLVHPRRHAA